MIPSIGIMVGAYIITRMVRLLIDKEDTGFVTTILSAITILVTLYCLYVLLFQQEGISEMQWLP